MKRHLAILFLLLTLGIGTPVRAEDTEADPLRAALRPEWVQLEADHRIAGDDRMIVVIGESHPIVAGQKNLANLLQRLLDEKQVQAVLVEGSEGPVETDQMLSQLSKLLSPEALTSYWQRQLEWGQLSGWEYVALIRPQAKAYGVENMIAKYRYSILFQNGAEDDLKLEVESAGRGAERLEKALTNLEQAGVTPSEARSALARHQTKIQDLVVATQRFGEKRKPLVAKQIALLEASVEIEGIFKETGLDELRGKKDAEVRFKERLVRLQQENPKVLARLAELFERRKTLEPELKGLEDDAEPAAKDLTAWWLAVQSSYFALANRLSTAAETRWKTAADARPAAVDESLRQVDTFFADEAEQGRKESLARAQAQLAERDRAMAENTEQYLRKTGARQVVLIVGAAHLEGIAENLERRGLPFVRSRLVPQDGEESWELRAWARRRAPFPVVLSTEDLKEATRLQDPVWQNEQVQRVKAWVQAPVDQAQPVRRKKKREPIVYRSSELPGKRFARSEQVMDYGPVPGHPDQTFEVWDRELGQRLISELSADSVQYAYGYFDVDAQKRRTYRVTTPQGDRTLESFLQTLPGKGTGQPSHVVILHEPDVRSESGVLRSPFWYAARRPEALTATRRPEDGQDPRVAEGSGGDGGRKDGNGSRTTDGNNDDGTPSDRRWTAFAADLGKSVLLRTTDARRSRENLAKLERQKPLEPSEMAFLKDPQELEGVKFTEGDGSHAGLVVLMAKNTEEFRAAVRRAETLKKLTDKQVALITCGDLHKENAELRESLLAAGVLMVWTPDRQITQQAGERLMTQIGETLKQGTRPRDINDLLERSIAELLRAHPDDWELKVLWESGSWVDLQPVDWKALPTEDQEG